MKITNEPKGLTSNLRYIDATVVLHNMLIKFGDDNDKDCPWRLYEDALSDIDDPQNRIPERLCWMHQFQLVRTPVHGVTS